MHAASYPNWRWMLNGNDSPWYPGMRLFRQKALQEGWTSVIAEVALVLSNFLPVDSCFATLNGLAK